jgi:predicted DsbA family dithiol-disulfide isomerase
VTLALEMVSDLVCPWCWLGKRRIEAAIARVPELDVQLYFRPFELDPSIPPGGADYKAYMAHRFGSDTGRERANMMRQALLDFGAAEGIPFRFDAITRRPSSFDAHRLVRWAQGQGKSAAAKEALFTAYFSEGRDIGAAPELIAIAESIGLDPAIVGDLLASDADRLAVRQETDLFRQIGISGVPTYIANRNIAVQGAEDVDKLVKFLKTADAQSPDQRGMGTA